MAPGSLACALVRFRKRSHRTHAKSVVMSHKHAPQGPRAHSRRHDRVEEQSRALGAAVGEHLRRDPSLVILAREQLNRWETNTQTSNDRAFSQPWTNGEERSQRAPQRNGLTVAQAFERYKEAHSRERRDGAGQLVKHISRKDRSRVSMIERHILPAFGPLIFASPTRTMVREEAENLIVVHKDVGGGREHVKASDGTMNNFITALKALWNECFPDVSAPFAGVRIRPTQADKDEDEEQSSAIFDHDNLSKVLHDAEGKGALDLPAVRRLLIAAKQRDEELRSHRRARTIQLRRPRRESQLMIPSGQ